MFTSTTFTKALPKKKRVYCLNFSRICFNTETGMPVALCTLETCFSAKLKGTSGSEPATELLSGWKNTGREKFWYTRTDPTDLPSKYIWEP